VELQKQGVMQNKKRLYKHLIVIYILYFVVLLAGFMLKLPSFASGFNAGMMQADREVGRGDLHSYLVTADIMNGKTDCIAIEGLPEHVKPRIAELLLFVEEPGALTVQNAFRIHADNEYVYLLVLVAGLSYLAIFVLIALIINSLRKSIRDEQPLRHSNIKRTRAIGILLIVAELGNAFALYLNHCKAAELLAGTEYEVLSGFPIKGWNLIVGLLFLFMAEVFSIGTQLSEEQKLTI